MDVPVLADEDQRASILLQACDAPITVSLYDEGRAVLRTLPMVHDAAIDLPEGARVYLKVEGSTQTRYILWVGRIFSFDEHHLENHHRLDNWWEDPHPEWVDRPEVDFGVLVNQEILDDGVLTLGDQYGQGLPTGVSVALLDANGHVVRVAEGERSGIIDVAGLNPGPYALRVTIDRTDFRLPTGFGVALQPPSDGFQPFA